MKEKLADHDPYSDLDIRTDRIKQWHPLNQSLYTGYKIMLPGMLAALKGRPHRDECVGRNEVPLSRRRRHCVLRGDSRRSTNCGG